MSNRARSKSKSDSPPVTEKKKTGRKSSGMPLEVVRRMSTAKRRNALLEMGKVRFDDYILPETKEGIRKIKVRMKCRTLGEAIDILVKESRQKKGI